MDDFYLDDIDHHDIERIEEDNEAPPAADEAEEAPDTVRVVKPKKIVFRPRLKLDGARLKGPRGLSVLEAAFKNVPLKGAGYEKRDLDSIMSVLEHWAHRLFPKMTFDDCLEKIEDLGHKVTVSNYVNRLRMGLEETDEKEPSELQVESRAPSPHPVIDPFDQLLDRPVQSQLSQEQRERMERNQLIALERRKARLKAKYEKSGRSNENTTVPGNDSDTRSVDVMSSVTDNTENDYANNIQPAIVSSVGDNPTETNFQYLDVNQDSVNDRDNLNVSCTENNKEITPVLEEPPNTNDSMSH